MNIRLRLFDFIITTNSVDESSDDSGSDTVGDGGDCDKKKFSDNDRFTIQMFGINTQGKTSSVIVNGFQPFFYVQLPNEWGKGQISRFVEHIREEIGPYYHDSLVDYKQVNKKTLYGFDDGKLYNFVHNLDSMETESNCN